MSDGGKGSAPRPIPDWDSFSKNFDAIFGGKDASKTKNNADVAGQEEGRDSRPNSKPVDDK